MTEAQGAQLLADTAALLAAQDRLEILAFVTTGAVVALLVAQLLGFLRR